jgi:hypothetical protein
MNISEMQSNEYAIGREPKSKSDTSKLISTWCFQNRSVNLLLSSCRGLVVDYLRHLKERGNVPVIGSNGIVQ